MYRCLKCILVKKIRAYIFLLITCYIRIFPIALLTIGTTFGIRQWARTQNISSDLNKRAANRYQFCFSCIDATTFLLALLTWCPFLNGLSYFYNETLQTACRRFSLKSLLFSLPVERSFSIFLLYRSKVPSIEDLPFLKGFNTIVGIVCAQPSSGLHKKFYIFNISDSIPERWHRC